MLLLFISACGLKTNPRAPADTDLPSLLEEYASDISGDSNDKQIKKK